jgi:hypothetical protein
MEDFEFRKRGLANPNDSSEDFIAAAQASAERTQWLQDLQALDARVHAAALSIVVPAGLAARLKSQADPATTTASVTPLPVRSRYQRYYAMAASLVITLGVIMSSGLWTARPSAADIKFHDDIIGHMYRETPRIDNATADLSMEEINQVIEAAGGHLREDERIKSAHIKFANDCNVVPSIKGAHIVLEGTKGSVSVIMIHNSPVSTEFDVNDPRFQGKIIPFGQGNLVILGEKEESLESYETLITETFEWVI